MIGIISAALGAGTTWIVREFMNKKLEEEKDYWEDTIDDRDHLALISSIVDDPVQRECFIKRYFEASKELYRASTNDMIDEAVEKIASIIDEIIEFESSNYEETVNNDEYISDELIKEMSEDLRPSETVNILNNGNYEVDGGDKDGTTNSEEHIKIVREEFHEVEQETDNQTQQSEEDEPSIQPQKDVHVKDDIDDVTAKEIEDEIDEDSFSKMIKDFVNPLIDKFGVEYEDNLVKMVDMLAKTTIDPDVYDQYTTRMASIVKFQSGEKGKRKLDKLITEFFSIYPEKGITE